MRRNVATGSRVPFHEVGHIVVVYRSRAPMSATQFPEQSPLPQPRSSVRPLLLLLIGLCTVFIVTYALRLDARDRVEAELVAQQQANLQAEARGAALEKQLAGASKPSYMDEIARTKLHLVKPNETRLIPVGGGLAVAAPAATAPSAALLPIWRQWVDFLFPRS